MKKIGFIGAGNMGGALARAAALCKDVEIYVTDTDTEKAKALAEAIGGKVSGSENIALECELVFLGVKPNVVEAALTPMSSALKKSGATVVSMAAGVSIEKIEKILGKGVPVLRIMPNTPASVGYGMILWTRSAEVSDGARDTFLEVMAGAGRLDELDERLIDAASALSGCGPAFVYTFIEALADGAVACGLPRNKAMIYATETLIGAANTVKLTGTHPGALKDAVCSPGGSTIEGVRALEESAFRGAAMNAVIAAYEKTKKLG